MKNVNETIRYGIENKDWEQSLEESFNRIETSSVELGKDQAINSQPPSKTEIEKSKPYIGGITGDFQKLVDESSKKMQVENQKAKAVKLEKQVSDELVQVEKDLNDVSNELRIEKREFEKQEIKTQLPVLSKKSKSYKRIRPLIIVIACVDSLISSTVLQGLGLSMLSAILLGCLVGLGLYVFSHYIPPRVHNAKTKAEKYKIILITGAVVSSIFFAFAFFRYEEGGIGKSVVFVLLNLFAFSAAFLLVYSKMLKPHENEKLIKFASMEESLSKLENKKEGLIKKQLALKSSVTNALESYEALKTYTKGLERTISSAYNSTFQKYCEANTFSRSDQAVPEFFHSNPPALILYHQ